MRNPVSKCLYLSFYSVSIYILFCYKLFFKTVFRIRIRSDSFNFGQTDPYPDPFRDTDPGSKSAQNHGKFPQKSTKISYNFFRILNFCLTDINIYLINNKTYHFLEKYIFNRKKGGNKVGIFSILHRIWSRIRYSTKQIAGSGFRSK